MANAQNKVKVEGKPIEIFQRGDVRSRKWHVRIWIAEERRYDQRSTKTEDLDEAKRIALNAWDEIRFKLHKGVPTRSRSFEAIAQLYLKERAKQQETGRLSKGMLHVDKSTINNWLLPFFKGKAIADIANKDVRDWQLWRRRYWKTPAGKARKRAHVPDEPTDQTMQAEASVLRGVLLHAVDLNELDQQQIPNCTWSIPKTRRGHIADHKRRRPDIPYEELQKLLAYIPKHRVHKNRRIQEQRNLLCDYVEFSLASGLRPKEAIYLKWAQITPHVMQNGTPNIVIRVAADTKTGIRQVLPMPAAKAIADRLKKRGHHVAERDYVFCLADGKPRETFKDGFKTLLDNCGILFDADGKKRTSYATRHTYATQRLMEGWPDTHLAGALGNSPDVIRRFYNHVKEVLAADETMSRLSQSARRAPVAQAVLHESIALMLTMNEVARSAELQEGAVRVPSSTTTARS